MPVDDDEFATQQEIDEHNRKERDLFPKSNVTPFPKKEETLNDEEEGILEWNKIYGQVMFGTTFKIIDESIPGKISFLDKKQFMDKHYRDIVAVQSTDPSGNIKVKIFQKTELWLRHIKSRKYQQVIFDPKKDHDPIGGEHVDYNLWRGFATRSIKGNCYKVLMYIRNVVCNGDKKAYRWLMAWVAHMKQRPWEKPETAIVIQGEEEGTGKSFFPGILRALLDGREFTDSSLYFKASNSKMITGDFSGHLERCLLLHAEECFSAESNKEDAIIKDLITEPVISINAKFREAKVAKNYLRIIFTGNSSHIIKAGQYARRFLVLEISNKYQQNTGFFNGLVKNLDNRGLEALSYFIDHYPIHKFDLRVAPKTIGLSRQKISSDRETEFWHVMLHTGELSFLGTSDGKYYEKEKEYHVIKYKLFSQFQRFMGQRVEKTKSNAVSFGMKFNQFFPVVIDGKIIKERDGKNTKMLRAIKYDNLNCYVIPSLRTCRALFGVFLGKDVDWPDNDEWIEKPFDHD
jgi:hypothetical protein